MLLTPQQKESCKAVKIELNEVIKKVGGDLFEGNYLTNPPSYGNKPAQKSALRRNSRLCLPYKSEKRFPFGENAFLL